MFGAKDDLGFSEDDLDLSRETQRRRQALWQAGRAAHAFNLAMVISMTPMVIALFVSTLRSDLPNRWTTFWCVTSILLAIALVLEVFLVNKQVRMARNAGGVFQGDARA